ncbi:MAG: hypothetical protein V9G09_09695 [Candidatus Nanopelagicales bacterium]|jgi:hypothetical protein|nr:hypothetical protein [Micrococcales bacterium]
MDEEMLEAHIAFEVAAWTESLTETLSAQTNVVFEWLDGVTLGSVFSEADLDALIDAIVIPDVSASVMAMRWWALNDQTPIDELMDREDYDRAARAVASLSDLQEEVVEQVTTSKVYGNLISHVLFNGIRNYVMTESPIARVPGASSLMRMGQNAFDTAAPRLSKGIERQLTAFVAANLQDSLRDSRTYLTTVVDEQAMTDIADEAWERNAGSTLAEIAGLIGEDALTELLAIGQDVIAYLVATPTFRGALQTVLDESSGRTVGELLAEAGITADMIIAMVRPWILRAADDGLLEQFVRERLTAFYSTY